MDSITYRQRMKNPLFDNRSTLGQHDALELLTKLPPVPAGLGNEMTLTPK